jgi:hypothetical protein
VVQWPTQTRGHRRGKGGRCALDWSGGGAEGGGEGGNGGPRPVLKWRYGGAEEGGVRPEVAPRDEEVGEGLGPTGSHSAGQRRQIRFEIEFQTNSNQIQILSNFDRSKKDLPWLKKIEVKYGCEGFEERNNFLHRNFYRLEMDFK